MKKVVVLSIVACVVIGTVVVWVLLGPNIQLLLHKPATTEVSREVAKERAERAARAAEYRDDIDYIRRNPSARDREQLVNSLTRKCMGEPIEGADAGYILMEAVRYGIGRGELQWGRVETAVDQYLIARAYDEAIACLNESIEALKTQDIDFGCYHSLMIRTPEHKEAVVEDLLRRVAEIEERKAGGKEQRVSAPSRASDEYPEAGELTKRPGLSAKEQAQYRRAEKAADSGKYEKAIEILLSMGDRENAAAVLWRTARELGGENRLRVAAEVIERFPETKQAEFAQYNRALILKKSGQSEKYEQALKEYVESHPQGDNVSDALYELYSVSHGAGRSDDEVMWLERLVEFQHEVRGCYVGFVFNLLAQAYENRGEHAKVVQLVADTVAGVREGRIRSVTEDTKLARLEIIQAVEGLLQATREFRGQTHPVQEK